MKILILEDNEFLLKAMNSALTNEGYKVDLFTDGEEALDALPDGYNCFILDINVPSLDGISILESIRMNHSKIPVIIMSSNHDLEKIEASYERGCNDYLKKPFHMYELIQKIKILCTHSKKYIKFDEEVKYDLRTHKLYEEEKEVALTKKEILFLNLFAQNLHHIATYEEIEEYVWEGEFTNLTNMRTLMARLRKKLPKDTISLLTNVGYGLNSNVKYSM